MRVSIDSLLEKLPPYQDQWVLIREHQEVKRDIIPEMVNGYKEFAPYYDLIAYEFYCGNIIDTCEKLFWFCKNNIEYREETEDLQISSLPTGILTRGYGDCKAYASFVGGCLGAIARLTGEKIDWHFCFASYEFFQPVPYHVFVVVDTSDGPIWIDPTPGADGKTPVWVINKKIKDSMALVRNVAGVNSAGSLVYEHEAVGAAVGPGESVSQFAVPLPDGYPVHLPRPTINNGKLQLTPFPPNFDPTPEQIAWMMLALQLWVYVYSPEPYDLFTYNSKTDGSGLYIADFITAMCKYTNNPEYYQNGHYIYPQIWGNTRYLATLGVMHGYPDTWDLLRPPPPVEPTASDRLTAIFRVAFNVVYSAVKVIIPGAGAAFITQWQNALNATGKSTLKQQSIIQAAGQVTAESEAVTEENKTADNKKKYLIVGGIAALLLLWWWWSSNNDE